MWFSDASARDAVLDAMRTGAWDLAWWQIVLFTLTLTHITIASVTIFLHRHQAHRALDLHPVAAHFFRFWLWFTTGTVTREWTAVHRKHHAKCEQQGDPHSPVVFGIKKVFWQGYELYRAECANTETVQRFGHNTPNDWLERHVYARYTWQGVALMLLMDVTLFGVIGLTVWAVQMLWIPVTAAGIINGIGHWWGYRNFESADASTNVSPWGLLIGGEELHNNHHTYPTSAKLSVKPYEFDIGWCYIRVLQSLRLATVKKTPPRLAWGVVKPVADEKTLEALIANRYEVMARYARELRRVCRAELTVLKVRRQDRTVLKAARRWLHRDQEQVPVDAQPKVAQARAANAVLDKMLTMREELRQLWLSRSQSREQLAVDLQAWCRRAEESGIAALQEFSVRLRAARA
jgi:stearoyl-CoA desaturase (delta-9 desaturase)